MDTRETLRAARKKAKLNQKQLAAAIGLSQGYLCDVENGRRLLIEKHAIRLPDGVRGPVIRAMVRELRGTIKRLREHV